MATPSFSVSSAACVTVPVDADAIAAEPAGGGQFEHALQAAVVGEEQQPLGVDVEAADGQHARAVRPGSAAKTVLRPSGSRAVVTSPFGL